MTDLTNNFPSWGETGEFPSAGFFYEGGDQVNEKHLDALWNGINVQFDEFIEGIEERVEDLSGDLILDSGLAVSQGGGTREVDITASSAGAYVNGQQTGSTSSATLTLTANGSGSTRTDSIWVNTNGQTGKSEGTTVVSDTRHKIAEVDVSTGDTITAVRDTGRHYADHAAAEESTEVAPTGGSVWYDTDDDTFNGYIDGQFRALAPLDGSQNFTGLQTFEDIVQISQPENNDFFRITDTTNGNDFEFTVFPGGDLRFTRNNNGLLSFNASNDVVLFNNLISLGGETIWDESNNYVPASSVQDVWVNSSGDTMTGDLDMGDNQVLNSSLLNVNMDDGSQALEIDGEADGTGSVNLRMYGDFGLTITDHANGDIAGFRPNGTFEMEGGGIFMNDGPINGDAGGIGFASPDLTINSNNNIVLEDQTEVNAKLNGVNATFQDDTIGGEALIEVINAGDTTSDNDAFFQADFSGTGEAGLRIAKEGALQWSLQSGDFVGGNFVLRDVTNSTNVWEVTKLDGDMNIAGELTENASL